MMLGGIGEETLDWTIGKSGQCMDVSDCGSGEQDDV